VVTLPLALLDVGTTEFLLIAGLFLALFGADKIPELARSAGRWSARVRSTAKQFGDQIDREQGVLYGGDAVPAEQRAQVEQAEKNELARLQKAARALGIDSDGKTEQELRDAIRLRTG
jgi:Sec-independent protein translocase protein TatA